MPWNSAALKTAVTLRTALQYHGRSPYYPTNKSTMKHTQTSLNRLLIPHILPLSIAIHESFERKTFQLNQISPRMQQEWKAVTQSY